MTYDVLFSVTQSLVSSRHRHSISCWTKNKICWHYITRIFFMNSLYSFVFCDLTTSGYCLVTFAESLTPTSELLILSSYLNFFIAYTSLKQWCLYMEDQIWSHCEKSYISICRSSFSLFSLMFQFLYPLLIIHLHLHLGKISLIKLICILLSRFDCPYIFLNSDSGNIIPYLSKNRNIDIFHLFCPFYQFLSPQK